MEIISLTVVGISVVFLCFLFLYLLLKMFERIFGPRKQDTEKQVPIQALKAVPGETAGKILQPAGVFAEAGITEEEIAAISAALYAYQEKPVQLVGVRRAYQEEKRYRAPRKYKTWKVHQKGDK